MVTPAATKDKTPAADAPHKKPKSTPGADTKKTEVTVVPGKKPPAPDRKAFETEVEKLNKQIDAVKVKFVRVCWGYHEDYITLS